MSWSADSQKGLTAYRSEDYATALREFKPLARLGHALSQFYLGVLYYKEQGVLQDYVRAHMWYNMAASPGLKTASGNRDTVAKQMNSNQIEKVQKLARECVRKKYKGC